MCMNGASPLLCNITSGHVHGDGASTICTCHCQVLFACPFFNEHELSQKLDDLEAVAIVSSKLTGFIKSNRRIAVNCITCMLN